MGCQMLAGSECRAAETQDKMAVILFDSMLFAVLFV